MLTINYITEALKDAKLTDLKSTPQEDYYKFKTSNSTLTLELNHKKHQIHAIYRIYNGLHEWSIEKYWHADCSFYKLRHQCQQFTFKQGEK